MSYADSVAADRRLMMLRALAVSGYGANETLVGLFLDSMGHAVSLDVLRGELTWLTEQGLIERVDAAVKLTRRGADVVDGRATYPGVRRPQPGEL